jgi:hypothetical protein
VDFVVVGFGLGALSILLGVILGGLVAGRCERAVARTADPAVAAYERANAAEYRGAGLAFRTAGAAVVLATVGGLAGALDDRTGALLVTTTATVAALGILLWGYLYRSRNPMPPRPRRPMPLTTIGGDAAVANGVARAASERPAATPVWATSRDEPGAAEAYGLEQAPMAEAGGEPGGAEEDNKSAARETEHPFHAEPAGMDDSDVNASPGMDPAEATFPDVGAAANGHLEHDEASASETKIVAFVARGASKEKDPERSAVSDDDAVNDR